MPNETVLHAIKKRVVEKMRETDPNLSFRDIMIIHEAVEEAMNSVGDNDA